MGTEIKFEPKGPIKKAARFYYQMSYLEYKKEVENPVSWDIYCKVLTDFLYEINKAIIVDKYEWKVPYFGGFLRISKKPIEIAENGEVTRWWYYWLWDKSRNIMHWPKSTTWSFKAVEGKRKRRREGSIDIGEYGLWKHIEAMRGNYTVMLKKRLKISHKEFVESL